MAPSPRIAALVGLALALAEVAPARASDQAARGEGRPAVSLGLAAAGVHLGLLAVEDRVPDAADAAGGDVVVLRDGGLVRGTIVEIRGGESVTIVAAVDGAARTYPWAEVASTQVAGISSPAGAAPSEGPPAAESGGGLGRPRLTIHARGRRAIQLLTPGEAPAGASATSTARSGVVLRSACQSPCGQVIDARAGYPFYFGGSRIPLSHPLYLNNEEGELIAEVRPGHVGLLTAGTLAAGYGGGGSIAGAVLLGASPERYGRLGGVLLGTGLALLIGGIAMIITGRTRFKLRRGRAR